MSLSMHGKLQYELAYVHMHCAQVCTCVQTLEGNRRVPVQNKPGRGSQLCLVAVKLEVALKAQVALLCRNSISNCMRAMAMNIDEGIFAMAEPFSTG